MRGAAEVVYGIVRVGCYIRSKMLNQRRAVYGIVRVGCYIRSKMLHQRLAAAHSRGLLSEHEFHAKKLKNSDYTL